jgi:hypothetical protein
MSNEIFSQKLFRSGSDLVMRFAYLYAARLAARSRMNLCLDHPYIPIYFPGSLHALLGAVSQTAFRGFNAVLC